MVLASIAGACAVHFVLAACGGASSGGANGGGGNGNGGSGDGTRDAFAQSAPPSCAAWQVATFYQPDVYTMSSGGDWPMGLSSTISLPAGWEPLATEPYAGKTTGSTFTTGALVTVRRCAQ